jgi:hypothetical protein
VSEVEASILTSAERIIMKAKDFIPASKPRNFVVKNQKTAGAGAHKDKKRAEKQGDVKHKNKVVDEDVAEGDSDWSGSQGNFAGDKPFNLGGDVAKRLDVNDTVSYFGEKATILAMSKDRTVSRIDLKSGITQNVKTSF